MVNIVDTGNQHYIWNYEIEGLSIYDGEIINNAPKLAGAGLTQYQRVAFDPKLRVWRADSYGNAYTLQAAGQYDTTVNIRIIPAVSVGVNGYLDRMQDVNEWAIKSTNTHANDLSLTNKPIRHPFGQPLDKTMIVKVKKLPDEIWTYNQPVSILTTGLASDGTDYSGYFTNGSSAIVFTKKRVDGMFYARTRKSGIGIDGFITTTVLQSIYDMETITEREDFTTYDIIPHQNWIRKINIENDLEGPVLIDKNGKYTSEQFKNNIYQYANTIGAYDADTDTEASVFSGIHTTLPTTSNKTIKSLGLGNRWMYFSNYFCHGIDLEENFTIGATYTDPSYFKTKTYFLFLPIFLVKNDLNYSNYEDDEYDEIKDIKPFSKIIPAGSDPYGKLKEDLVVTWYPTAIGNISGVTLVYPWVASASHQSGSGSSTQFHSPERFNGPKVNLNRDIAKYNSDRVQTNLEDNSVINHQYFKDPDRGLIRDSHFRKEYFLNPFPLEITPDTPGYPGSSGVNTFFFTGWSGDPAIAKAVSPLTNSYGTFSTQLSSYLNPYYRFYDLDKIKGKFYISWPQHDDNTDIGLDGREAWWRLEKSLPSTNQFNYGVPTWLGTSSNDYSSPTALNGWTPLPQTYTVPQDDDSPLAVWELDFKDIAQYLNWHDDPSRFRIVMKVEYYNKSSPNGPYIGPFYSYKTILLKDKYANKTLNINSHDGWWVSQPQGACPYTTFRIYFDKIVGGSTIPTPSTPILGTYHKTGDVTKPASDGAIGARLIRNDNKFALAIDGDFKTVVDVNEGYFQINNSIQYRKSTHIKLRIDIEDRNGKFRPFTLNQSNRNVKYLEGSSVYVKCITTGQAFDSWSDPVKFTQNLPTPPIVLTGLDHAYRVRINPLAFAKISSWEQNARPIFIYDLPELEVTIPKLENVRLNIDSSHSQPQSQGSRTTDIAVNVSSQADDNIYPPGPVESVRATIQFKDNNGNVLLTLSNQALNNLGGGQWGITTTAPLFFGTDNGTVTITSTYSYTNYTNTVPSVSNINTMPFAPQHPYPPSLAITDVTFS